MKMSSSNNISISDPDPNSNNIDSIRKFEEKCIPIKRCFAYNKYGKLCRTKINNEQLFCCDAHNPINDDILKGCFLCMEEIKDTNEIIYLKCRHAFHKPCYLEWLDFSTYENPICLLCRRDFIRPITNTKNKSNVIKFKFMDERLIKLSKLYQNIIYK